MASESVLMMPVKILKNEDVLLANDAVFRILPLTIDQALIRGVLPWYEEPLDEDVSPSKAGALC